MSDSYAWYTDIDPIVVDLQGPSESVGEWTADLIACLRRLPDGRLISIPEPGWTFEKRFGWPLLDIATEAARQMCSEIAILGEYIAHRDPQPIGRLLGPGFQGSARCLTVIGDEPFYLPGASGLDSSYVKVMGASEKGDFAPHDGHVSFFSDDWNKSEDVVVEALARDVYDPKRLIILPKTRLALKSALTDPGFQLLAFGNRADLDRLGSLIFSQLDDRLVARSDCHCLRELEPHHLPG